MEPATEAERGGKKKRKFEGKKNLVYITKKNASVVQTGGDEHVAIYVYDLRIASSCKKALSCSTPQLSRFLLPFTAQQS